MEKKLKEEHEKIREGRVINGLMALATGRITAGVLAGMGQHKFSDPKLLTVVQIKFSKSQGERQRIINNRYDRDI